MNADEIKEQVKLVNSNDPHHRNVHEGWRTRNAHLLFKGYVALSAELEAERATVQSLLSRIHEIRVAAKLPESTMLGDIPARIAELLAKESK